MKVAEHCAQFQFVILYDVNCAFSNLKCIIQQHMFDSTNKFIKLHIVKYPVHENTKNTAVNKHGKWKQGNIVKAKHLCLLPLSR